LAASLTAKRGTSLECMSIKHTILGLLANGPLHGYELKAAFERDVVPWPLEDKEGTSLNFGQVYTALDRLKDDGLVQAQTVAQEKQPDKKVYALTEAGRKELHDWLSRPSRPNLDLRNETILKLMLARRLPDVNPREVIDQERRACFAKLKDVTNARAETADQGGVAMWLLLDLAVRRLQAFLEWLDHCEEVLKKEKPK
jgi:DNA-binding PadR family transcriptional regulator